MEGKLGAARNGLNVDVRPSNGGFAITVSQPTAEGGEKVLHTGLASTKGGVKRAVDTWFKPVKPATRK